MRPAPRLAALAAAVLLGTVTGCDGGPPPESAPTPSPEAAVTATPDPALAAAATRARRLVADLVARVPADTVVEQLDQADDANPCQEPPGGPDATTQWVVSTRLYLTPGADYADVVEQLRRAYVAEDWTVKLRPSADELRWTLAREGWTVSFGAAPGRGDVGPQMVIDAASACLPTGDGVRA